MGEFDELRKELRELETALGLVRQNMQDILGLLTPPAEGQQDPAAAKMIPGTPDRGAASERGDDSSLPPWHPMTTSRDAA
jgi:hypothetical protein